MNTPKQKLKSMYFLGAGNETVWDHMQGMKDIPLKPVKIYKCKCGWIGSEGDMDSDHMDMGSDMDEVWSNWICPDCGDWHCDGLGTYTRLN